MQLPWLAQQYQRTCAECGCTWRVPRYFARRHVLAVPVRQSLSGPELQADLDLDQQAESLRKCPKCGSVRYSQRPVRLRGPDKGSGGST
jgi:predicted nucleic-acid-binding Zn-ribbon protein